ncbi:MAG: nuclear transport factor 2 family protein, partial [Porticoccaceae bacterium]|nr:nuclear transport factor 2 family protein [Porticoccaceae bacterium]
MGLFDKMEKAIQDGDVEAVAAFYHPDFQMKMHSSGAVMTKEQWREGAASI